jgi:hypothetical protein
MNASDGNVATAWLRANASRLALLALYMLVSGYAIAGHAMWRDEMQAWLIARDSAGIRALFHNLHYEGHPALWYLLLMPLTRLGRDPVLMQALNFVIAAATVALVLWRAPLSAFERALFPFGYFVLYEYAVKSRSYALGCLLLFVFAALWQRRRDSPLLIAFVLALMANVHALFMIVSAAAVAALVVDRLVGAPSGRENNPASRHADVLAIAIVGMGWGIAILTAMPPPDSGFVPDWFFGVSFRRFRHSALALVAIFLLALVRFRNSPAAATLLGASLFGLLAFFYIKYPGAIWHHGIGAMLLLAAVWVDRSPAHEPAGAHRFKPLVPAVLFGAALAVQALAGVVAVRGELQQPLSRGRDVARFIVAQGWARDPIVGVDDFRTVPIIGYLGVDRAYYANGQRWGSFTVWDRQRLQPVDMRRVLADTVAFGPAATLIVAAGTEVDPALLHGNGFDEVARFDGAKVPEENYTIYRRPGSAASLRR